MWEDLEAYQQCQRKEGKHNQYGKIFWLWCIVLKWSRLLSLWLWKSFHLGEKKFWGVWTLHKVLLVLWGEIKALLPIRGQSQSGRKNKNHWALVLKVKENTRKFQVFLGLFQGEKVYVHRSKCFFSALVSSKEFQTLNNQISNSFSPEEELIKSRLWGIKWEQKFPYPWAIPHIPHSRISVPLFVDGPSIYFTVLDYLQVRCIVKRKIFLLVHELDKVW